VANSVLNPGLPTQIQVENPAQTSHFRNDTMVWITPDHELYGIYKQYYDLSDRF